MDWETLNTPKIKTVFHSYDEDSDYGTKLRIKCQQRIKRREKTIDGELCTNWDRLDTFGVAEFYDRNSTKFVRNFYDDPIGLADGWPDGSGNGL